MACKAGMLNIHDLKKKKKGQEKKRKKITYLCLAFK